MSRDYFWLTGAQFAKLKPHLPPTRAGSHGWITFGYQRHHRCNQERCVGRCACGIWLEQDALQPLPALGTKGVWSEIFSCSRRCGWTTDPASHRFFGRAYASLRGRGTQSCHRSIRRPYHQDPWPDRRLVAARPYAHRRPVCRLQGGEVLGVELRSCPLRPKGLQTFW